MTLNNADSDLMGFFGGIWQDIYFSLRALRKARVYTVLTVITLGLGLGASTAVFSLVNTVLLKPLPYPNASRLFAIWRTAPVGSFLSGSNEIPWSPFEYQSFKETLPMFDNIGLYKKDTVNLTATAAPELLEIARVSSGFFPAFGSAPLMGRVFSVDEDRPGSEHVAVLSERFWRSHLGGNPNVLGYKLQLNGAPYIVVGVMSDSFRFPNQQGMPPGIDLPRETQLWVPLALPPNARGASEMGMIAEPKSSVSSPQVNEALARFDRSFDEQSSAWKGWGTIATPLGIQVTSDARRPLLLFLTAVCVVLLIACANVAGLALNRSLARRQEVGIRQALGAKRSHLARLFLIESLLIAMGGGITGFALAWVLLRFAQELGPTSIPHLHDTTLDGKVLLFSACVTFLTGVVFGAAPALAVRRTNLSAMLKEGGVRGSQGGEVKRLRNGFLITQIAFALVLTVSAGLLVRTFMHMLRSNAGFAPERVLSFELPLPTPKYSDTERMAQVYEQIRQNLLSLPGVQQAGFSSVVPMAGAPDWTMLRFPDRPTTNPNDRPFASYSFLSPGYFSTIHASLLQGRDFADTDTLSNLHVAIVNAAMAKKYWPGRNPIGKQLGVPITRFPLRTVVGVVGDIKHNSLREASAPEMWVPFTQNEIKAWPSMQTMQYAIRTSSDTSAASEQIQRAVHAADPDLPVANLATLETLVSDSMVQDRFALLLIAGLGTLALVLAAVGTYGVLSYTILQSTREIGVRLALGASRSKIFLMVLAQGSRVGAYGIALGVLVSLASTHVMARFLYGVRPNDAITMITVILLLLFVLTLASLLPARRAMRTEITSALRYD